MCQGTPGDLTSVLLPQPRDVWEGRLGGAAPESGPEIGFGSFLQVQYVRVEAADLLPFVKCLRTRE